ncbi:hypothetical protein LAZ67_5001177 [Cordylochernes scorpioides]|uniref:RNA-directed DNA polymerase n=1 Tax=Cordylochernes scorpioides TaxID=51811 RepID=A0ABY6KGF9_9ARAC|nr:hypothetical protein LAZ67_5001177 [Cordylochernes scorpioides]
MKIIEEIEQGKSHSQVSRERNIPRSTISTIFKNKFAIKSAFLKSNFSSTLKRDRGGEFPEIEEALFRWIRQANAMKLAINGNILKEKAILLALKMGQDNFEASNGWLEKFKARRNIAFKRLHGEAGSVDANSVATWKGEIIPSLLAKYSPQDIFNADETGLFYKLLPNQTMTIRGEKCEGGKKSKERITVLVCCNMDGSEKLPLLYIGKYRRPRCFHGMNIPSNYHFNKKAWMTGAIFTDWLKKLDQIFKRRERKILLILDNCPAHQIPEGLQNIEIRFLPALTTSALQPCDMGIIKALKDQYRKRMITYLLTCMEEKKNAQVHLLFAISWLEAAWVGVSSSTIKNCFSHSGFVMDEAMEEVVEEEMNRCFEALKKHQAIDVNYIDFLEVDKDVQVAGEQSIEEIVKEVMGKEEDEETASEEKGGMLPSQFLELVERKRLQLSSEERIEDIVATFDFIAQRETIDYLNDHGRIVFCVRGFPGSGKESLRELLEQTYPTAKIFCAKLCPFDKDQSNRGKSHSWCKDLLIEALKMGHSPLILVNSFIKEFELEQYLIELRNFDCTIIMMDTSNFFEFGIMVSDPQDLVKTTHQKLDEEYFSKRLSKWCDYIPWYTGWFLNPADSDELFQYAIKVLDPISYALETELNLDLFGIEIGCSTIGTIVSDVLNFRKVCTKWVPRLLSENHKQQWMEAARAFLEMHQRVGDQLFSRIVTGDKSWVHHSTPETKRQSMARTTQTLMENFKWEIFTHPPYSSELAPSDFHLFPALKLHLGGKHFANDYKLQAEANHWLRILLKHFNPKTNIIYERFVFQKMDQKSGETISKYIIRLKEQAQRCNFGDVLQESLRDRFVAGIIDTPTQKKLLQEEGLTFEGALDIALSAESADNDLHNLKRSEDAHLSPQHLHAINNPCKHCGKIIKILGRNVYLIKQGDSIKKVHQNYIRKMLPGKSHPTIMNEAERVPTPISEEKSITTPRQVPFALKQLVENEIDKLVDLNILSPIDKSDCASPLVCVAKPNGQIRLCADFKKSLNPYLEDVKYPIPNIDSVLSNFQGKDNIIPDFLSRFPECQEDNLEYNDGSGEILLLNTSIIDHVLVAHEIQLDRTLFKLYKIIETGELPSSPNDDLIPYLKRIDDFTILQECIFLENRMVVPKSLHERVLQILHESHAGTNKMKMMARSSIWWPGMDSSIEIITKNCRTCLSNESLPPQRTESWPKYAGPWRRVHMDYFNFKNKLFLLAVDSFSSWVEVSEVPSTSAYFCINFMRNCIARYGFPQVVVSDNGPPFFSSDFGDFLSKNGISHVTSPPYHPQSNGQAEVSVREVKKLLKKQLYENEQVELNLALSRALFFIRTDVNIRKGTSPAELFLGRKIRSRLSVLSKEEVKTQLF